jgi:signal transduction histidine kinase
MSEQAASNTLSQPQPARILYLEPCALNVQPVQAQLQAQAWQVDVAPDLAAGRQMMEQADYALILLSSHLCLEANLPELHSLVAQTALPILVFIIGDPDTARIRCALDFSREQYLFQGNTVADLQLLPPIIELTLQRHQHRLEQQRLLEHLRQDNRNLMLLTRLAQLLTSTLETDQVISQLVQAITEIVVTEGSSVWLRDPEQGDHLLCAAMYLNGKDITSDKLLMPIGQGIVGWVAQHGQRVNVVNVASDPRFSSAVDSATGYTTKSILAVPLITRNQVIGVLEFVNKVEGHFNARDEEMAETVAAYAANAIENARLMESFRRQRDLLERQNEALDAFAHSVAHDLKNPLTLVVGFADMLREDYENMSPLEVQESLNTIVEYGVKMNSIVDALLMLADVGVNETVESQPVDMGEITRAVLRRMEHMIREYEAEVLTPDEWPVALGYGSWLEEVWYNYLSNGLKYGGRPPRLELGYDEPLDGYVRFWVQDNGAGFTAENPMSLFTRSHRRERNSNGHGLGLSIVFRIIARLGGRVEAESYPGQGSRFSFTLPAASAEASMA